MRTLLRGGRVVDPATGFDGAADVLVGDGRVLAVGSGLPPAEDQVEIDVAGYLVGPGFVDLHSHVHSIAGHRLQAMDGVTMALDLEAGMMPVGRAYAAAAAAGRPLHYGFSASWGSARAKVLAGVEPDANFATALSVLGTAVTCQDAADPADRAGREVRNTIPSGRTSRFGRDRTYLRECGHRCRANRIRV